MLIRNATARDADHLVRFINMAADNMPQHFWQKTVGPDGDAFAFGKERAARDFGNFSFKNAHLVEIEGEVAACLLGYPADDEPAPIAPDTPQVFVPLLKLEAMAPGSWYLNVLATYEPFRGKGSGGALLAKAEEIASSMGKKSISLIAANTHQEAQRLYLAKGFKEQARLPVVKDDWVVDAETWILFIKTIG